MTAAASCTIRMSDVKASQGPEGRPPNVSPARKGWESIAMIASAVGAALTLAHEAVLSMGLHEVSDSSLGRPHPRCRLHATSLPIWRDRYAAAFVVSAENKFKFLDFSTRHKALHGNSCVLNTANTSTPDFS